jgi:cell division protease FtsH
MAFEDVYGYDDIKRKLLELKGWYDKKKEYDAKGIDLPRGLLLYGKAGCGKSLIAEEFAHLLDPNPIVITSKKDTVSKFNQAKKESKEKGVTRVVMIDELDLLITKDDDVVRLVQSGIDGFNKDCSVFTIATANHISDIPNPLLRSGRFDYRLFFGLPNQKERIVLMKNFFLRYGIPQDGLDFSYLSNIADGSSCADLKLVCNTVRLRLDPNYSNERIEDVITESLNPQYEVTKKEDRKEFIAIHEAGHALMTILNDDKIHFFRSLMCHGDNAGGMTICNDNDDVESYEKDYARIQVSLAGKCAEEVVIAYHGIGATNDYQVARTTAATLVARCGYGRGAVDIMPGDGMTREPTQEKHRQVELRYEAILAKAETETRTIITEHATEIKKMADILMDKGVLTRKEAFGIVGIKDSLLKTE